VLTFKRHQRYFVSPRDQTPEEWAALKAAYEAYPDAKDAAKREQYVRQQLKKGPPDLDKIPVGPPPNIAQKAAFTTIPAVDGHYYPKVTINGQPVRMIADTGASTVSLTDADAQKAGVDCKTPGREVQFNTANGPRKATVFTLPEITVEGVTLRDVDASCGTKSDTSLLGVSALKRFNVRFTSNGYMVLSVPN
jgi:clan AA aspartic protease (TIGR02281 family)